MRSWGDDIGLDLEQVKFEALDWIQLAQDRLFWLDYF